QSGPPITLYSATVVSLAGTVSGASHAFRSGQPISSSYASRAGFVDQFFNTNAFIDPTCGFDDTKSIEGQDCAPSGIKYSLLGRYGNAGKGILSGPALANTDLSILKDFAFRERYRLQFRTDFF